jgi:benzoyl-CoA reductase/2-hydroxyglutaryl-CoA dehydratase subunit BcrC/BadD/HgdB
MENCTGIKGVRLTVDETCDPLQSLAERYLNIPCSCMTPNTGRFSDLKEISERFGADAFLDLTWLGCHTYNAESYLLQNFVETELKKPFLHIETDYSESDTEQLRTRIEALIELI